MLSLRAALPLTPNNPNGLGLDTRLHEREIERKLADGSTTKIKMQLGTLTARFSELRGIVFRWDCLFDPTLAPQRAILGLGGRVLENFHISFRGASPDWPDGSVLFDVRVGPVPLFPLSDPLVWECHYEPAGWPKPAAAPASP